MTSRQAEILKFIKEYIRSYGHAPSYQNIADGMGLSSLATVHKHIHCLKAQGRLSIDDHRKYSIKIIAEPVDDSRFEIEGNRLWDKKLICYWVREDGK